MTVPLVYSPPTLNRSKYVFHAIYLREDQQSFVWSFHQVVGLGEKYILLSTVVSPIVPLQLCLGVAGSPEYTPQSIIHPQSSNDHFWHVAE